MARHRIAKVGSTDPDKYKNAGKLRSLNCQICGKLMHNVGFDADAITCSRCVALQLEPDLVFVERGEKVTPVE